jgi:hypothetical protein
MTFQFADVSLFVILGEAREYDICNQSQRTTKNLLRKEHFNALFH